VRRGFPRQEAFEPVFEDEDDPNSVQVLFGEFSIS
jgi:hypothetical protein